MISVEGFIGLLLPAIPIALIAKGLDQPLPFALVLGGVELALIPSVPKLSISPEMVFSLLLPPILMLAIGPVTTTSTLVAFLCERFIPGMT